MKRRNSALDILKGICIIFILITHFRWEESDRIRFLFPFWIDMAVPIFMVITGYVYTKTLLTADENTIDSIYSSNFIRKRIIKYTVPFLLIFGLEIFSELVLHLNYPIVVGTDSVFGALLTGGWGPGSYYYPVLIQIVLLFPLMFKLVNSCNKGLFYSFLLTLFYEIIKYYYFIQYSEQYRLLAFRYTFLICFGIYLAISDRKKMPKVYYVFMLCGAFFSIATQYLNCKPYFFSLWTTCSLPASLMIMPLLWYATRKTETSSILLLPFEKIGKNTYCIFLFQMMFYRFWADYFVYSWIKNGIVQLMVCIILSIIGGYIFNLLQKPITDKVLFLLKRK